MTSREQQEETGGRPAKFQDTIMILLPVVATGTLLHRLLLATRSTPYLSFSRLPRRRRRRRRRRSRYVAHGNIRPPGPRPVDTGPT